MARIRVTYQMQNAETLLRNATPGSRATRKILTSWSTRYKRSSHARFRLLSQADGGGVWKPMAESTKRQRRHGRGGGHKRGTQAYRKAIASGGGQISLLWDTGLLRTALDPSGQVKPGGLLEFTDTNVLVGFGGPAKHGEDDFTIAQLAEWHHYGGTNGRPPKRELLVEPTEDVKSEMVKDAVTILSGGSR